MTNNVNKVLQFVRENDVSFIRLGFCDSLGFQKNISVMPSELEAAFEHGIAINAFAVKGFQSAAESDLFILPDPNTLTAMPWRPSPGRVVRFYCDLKKPDGSYYEFDSRYILKKALERCEKMNFDCKIGAECEFYLFKTDENGEPTYNPLDKGSYLDISPLDKGENIRREICLNLEEIGITPESSHHEHGPGQNEIDFKFNNALSCADNLMTFKSVVKAIASRNGLFASFMPKPIQNQSGSGLHINISLSKNGKNIFAENNEYYSVAQSFLAGVLEKVAEMTLFLNPTANSYSRFGEFQAPKYISWSKQNRSVLIRIPAADDRRARMELRSPDPSANPYLAFALILSAGLDGIERNLKLPDSSDFDLFNADSDALSKLSALPLTLDEAINIASNSEFLTSVVGTDILDKYISIKKEEAADFNNAKDKDAFFKDKYFNLI